MEPRKHPSQEIGINDVEIVVLDGGKEPERKTNGAIGYDVYARAVVCKDEMSTDDPRLRRTIFDFKNIPSSAALQERIIPDPIDSKKWSLILKTGEHALVGVGFISALPLDMLYWLTPRSGLSLNGVSLLNAPGTVDPDYRGEAGVLLFNRGDDDFILSHGDRIAQAVFCPVYLPKLVIRHTVEELSSTARGTGGFGSTGLHD